MKKAIEAVNNNPMSQRQAVFAFGVPKSSLNDRSHGKPSGVNGRDILLSSTKESDKSEKKDAEREEKKAHREKGQIRQVRKKLLNHSMI